MWEGWRIQVSIRACLVNSRTSRWCCCSTRDYQVLKNDYVVLLASVSRSSVGVSLLIGRSLIADVNLVLADDRGRLLVADVAIKSFEFLVVAVYMPNIAAGRVYFFRRLAPFLDNPKRIANRPSLVGNWKFNISLLTLRYGTSGTGKTPYFSRH